MGMGAPLQADPRRAAAQHGVQEHPRGARSQCAAGQAASWHSSRLGYNV